MKKEELEPCNTKVMKYAVTATLCHLRADDNPVSHIFFGLLRYFQRLSLPQFTQVCKGTSPKAQKQVCCLADQCMNVMCQFTHVHLGHAGSGAYPGNSEQFFFYLLLSDTSYFLSSFKCCGISTEQVPIITYIITDINNHSINKLSIFSLLEKKNKKEKNCLTCYRETRLSCGGKLIDRYKVLILETSFINALNVSLQKSTTYQCLYI